MKRFLLALVAVVLAVAVAGCAKDSGEATEIKFGDATELSDIRRLDGKTVTMVGYMATLSPLNGEYVYLMNLPYQSCPFCVPNTTRLANTMAVYAQKGKEFSYTEQAVRVTGRMEIGDYTDDFGYAYSFRIVDATYEVVDLSVVSDQYALWMSIAEDGLVGELTRMFDYLSFVTSWTEYTAGMDTEDGTISYYMTPDDAKFFLDDDGAYGFTSFRADGYFDALTRRVNAVSATELTELTALIEDAHALADYAVGELEAGRYVFEETTEKYFLTNAEDLNDQFYALYTRYTQWLAQWEL